MFAAIAKSCVDAVGGGYVVQAWSHEFVKNALSL
jgi:hypothetical protein